MTFTRRVDLSEYLSLVIVLHLLFRYVGALLCILLVLRVEIMNRVSHDVLRVHCLLQKGKELLSFELFLP